jgi:transposase
MDLISLPQPASGTCAADTKSGKPCRRKPLAGGKYCHAHSGAPVGRPTKLTPQVHERIVGLIEAGSYAEPAARAAGISASTFYSWMERGELEEDGIFREFREAIKRAEAVAEVSAVKVVTSAMPRSWQAAMTFLERKHPDRWGRRTRAEPSEQPATNQRPYDLSRLTDDELETLDDLLRKAERQDG